MFAFTQQIARPAGLRATKATQVRSFIAPSSPLSFPRNRVRQ